MKVLREDFRPAANPLAAEAIASHILDRLTDDLVEAILPKVAKGLNAYLWLQCRFRQPKVDVSKDAEFQRHYNGFYKVRLKKEWQKPYYRLMQAAKAQGSSFADVLCRLKQVTGRIEASFASKLVATSDPSMPVIDKFVLKNLQMHLPRNRSIDREEKTITFYKQLFTICFDMLTTLPRGLAICQAFHRFYREAKITKTKMLDLILCHKCAKTGATASFQSEEDDMKSQQMRALSIRQPHAEAIMHGAKPIEFRSRPTHVRGRVHIYASLGRYPGRNRDAGDV